MNYSFILNINNELKFKLLDKYIIFSPIENITAFQLSKSFILIHQIEEAIRTYTNINYLQFNQFITDNNLTDYFTVSYVEEEK